MYRVGLIGCGRIAQRHAALLGENQIEGAQLCAVCDTIPVKAMLLAEKYDVAGYTSMDVMMREAVPDIVSVLTPSGMHAEHVIHLAQFGKHIIVEKPIALTVSDADAMIQACDVMNIYLAVVKQNRYNLPIVQLKQVIINGRFGKLILGAVRVRWCRHQNYYDDWHGSWAWAGGVLANQAIHHIDALLWMLGPIESVFGYSKTALAQAEVEDTLVAILRFQNGALGTVEATTCARPKDTEGSLSILGERGLVDIGGFALNKTLNWQFDPELPEDVAIRQYSENPPDVYGFGHRAFYNDVITHIQQGKEPPIGWKEGREALAVVTAIYESIETRRPIRVNLPTPHCRLGKND